MKLPAAAATAATLLLPTLATSADDWQFQGQVYFFLPAIGGTTQFPPGTGPGVEIDVSKILESLQAAFMGSFEARKGRWGGFADVVYADLATGRSGTRDISFDGVSLPADASATLDYRLNGWAWTAVGTYAAVERPQATLYVLGGLRLLDITQELGWVASGNVASIALPSREGAAGSRLKNLDAVIGVRGRLNLDARQRWFASYYLDVGTGDSDFTWQVATGVGCSFGWGDAIAAWRHLDYEMKPGQDIQSLNFSGPAIGVAFRW
jgi:hypothetical protein